VTDRSICPHSFTRILWNETSDDGFPTVSAELSGTLLCGTSERATEAMQGDDAVRGPYVDTEMANGGVVIYDARNERAWIQSDTTVTVGRDV